MRTGGCALPIVLAACCCAPGLRAQDLKPQAPAAKVRLVVTVPEEGGQLNLPPTRTKAVLSGKAVVEDGAAGACVIRIGEVQAEVAADGAFQFDLTFTKRAGTVGIAQGKNTLTVELLRDGQPLSTLVRSFEVTAKPEYALTPSAGGGGDAVHPAAVHVADPVGAVLRKLGRRHFMLGVMCGPGDRWIPETRAQGCAWDMRYQYLSGGVNTGNKWYGGAFVTNYLNESEKLGTIPVFSWYMMYQSRPGIQAGRGEAGGNKMNCENADTMRDYFTDLRAFMQAAGAWGRPVVFHHEPDLWGYFRIAPEFRPNDPDTVRVLVKSSGIPEVAEYPDTAAGFGRAIAGLRDRLAPNVLLAWHASKWGNPAPKAFAEFVLKCGKWDLIFTDPSDRDSAWKIARGYHAEGAWWTDKDFESFRDWSGDLHRLTGLPLIAWQIPIGNTVMAACNNTPGHYMDNRVQYWLEGYPANRRIAEWAACGYIALLFGGGAEKCTGFTDSERDGVTNPEPIAGNKGEKSAFPDDDGGFLRLRGGGYYKAGPVPLAGGK
jgi:hypothetical protein